MMTVRTLGRLCVAGGVIGAAGGLVTAFVPAAVGIERFSYPYTPGWFVVAQTVFLVNHVLILAGVLGVLRAGVAGRGRFAAWGGAVSLAGLAILSLCEVGAMFLLHAATSAAAVGWLNAGYGLAAVLTGAGPALLGVAVARAGAWHGWRRWIVLACGVELLAAMPLIGGPFLAGRFALTIWAALYIPLGLALAQPANTASTLVSEEFAMNTTIRWGLALATLLGLLDIAGVSGVWADDGPPAALAITGGILGLVTIVATTLARRRGAIPAVITSRVLSGLLSLPVYWADSAPDWSKLVVGIALAVTVAAVALLTVGSRAARPA